MRTKKRCHQRSLKRRLFTRAISNAPKVAEALFYQFQEAPITYSSSETATQIEQPILENMMKVTNVTTSYLKRKPDFREKLDELVERISTLTCKDNSFSQSFKSSHRPFGKNKSSPPRDLMTNSSSVLRKEEKFSLIKAAKFFPRSTPSSSTSEENTRPFPVNVFLSNFKQDELLPSNKSQLF